MNLMEENLVLILGVEANLVLIRALKAIEVSLNAIQDQFLPNLSEFPLPLL